MDTYNYYLCREVPEDYVDTVCQDVLPTKSWEEWYDKGQSWTVLMIMKDQIKTPEREYWINDWVYRVLSSGKHFYLHMVNQADYDLMDAFGVPHLNASGKEVDYALGWEPAKAVRDPHNR